MLITKGEVSFGGQQELLNWSVIPGLAGGDFDHITYLPWAMLKNLPQ